MIDPSIPGPGAYAFKSTLGVAPAYSLHGPDRAKATSGTYEYLTAFLTSW